MINRTKLIAAIIVIAAAILIAIAFSSCNTSKHTQQSMVSFDSSYLKEQQDSVRVLKTENERLQSEIDEMTYAGVQFDTLFIAGKNDTIINTVTITKEGDIKATGNILSAYVSKSVLTKIVNEKQATVDSLSKALDTEKKNIKTIVETKEVEKKVKVLPGWIWFLVVIGVIGWEYLRRLPIIKNFLKL